MPTVLPDAIFTTPTLVDAGIVARPARPGGALAGRASALVLFVEALPRNATGKVLERELRG